MTADWRLLSPSLIDSNTIRQYRFNESGYVTATPTSMNLFKTLDQYGLNVAIYTEDGIPLTYTEMLRQADEVGRTIQNRSLVFILATNDTESITGYVGVMRAGSVAVLLDHSIKSVFLAQLLNEFRPHYVYLSKKNLDEHGKHIPFLQSSQISHTNDSYALVNTNSDHKYPIHPELALLLTTSGSTGTQKFVRQSYKNIYANAHSIATYLGIEQSDRAITTLPPSYTFGLSILHSHLLLGASIILTEASVIEKRFWDICKKFHATTFGGVPYTFEILKKIGFETMQLDHLRYITQAGGKLSKELSLFFAQVCLQKNIHFIVMYGQTEATARMSYLPWKDAMSKAGSIGIAIPGGMLYLKDENGTIIEDPFVPGELAYKGDNVTLGYAQNYADLSKGDENHGVLKTGDIAERDGDGYYYIVGRQNRFIKILGKRINLDDIESWLRKHGHDCACTGDDDDLKVYITRADTEGAVGDMLRETFGLSKQHFSITRIDEIPRNTSNKIQYARLP